MWLGIFQADFGTCFEVGYMVLVVPELIHTAFSAFVNGVICVLDLPAGEIDLYNMF